MTNAQRLESWLAAHTGQARIVLGTRMSVFASLPGLQVIVVDEEHDPSYKQQEGARYSARDLALWRGHELRRQSASWAAPRPRWRAGTPQPADPKPWAAATCACTCPAALARRAAPRAPGGHDAAAPATPCSARRCWPPSPNACDRGEQSLVLLNRRGFAPVLYCADCGWKSDCPHCSAHQVFHKGDRTLRCHHCGYTARVPHACPACGNPDILATGPGHRAARRTTGTPCCATCSAPTATPPALARIDADTTKAKGALEAQLAQVHAGEVDVLVGTQMVAKGHDFRRITLVAAVQPDGALFSSDFRAPERLFCLLMQAAGRAGRDASYISAQGSHPEMWVQTFRAAAHASTRPCASTTTPALPRSNCVNAKTPPCRPSPTRPWCVPMPKPKTPPRPFCVLPPMPPTKAQLPDLDDVFLYPPIPMTVQRVANVERAQMLLEATDRRALQRFLACLATLAALRCAASPRTKASCAGWSM